MKIPTKITQIFEQVKDFDLVITSDVVLSSALNKLIERPMIEKFAYSPKELANKYALKILNQPIASKSSLVLNISKKLNKPISYVHNILEKILDIEKHTFQVSNHLKNFELEVYNIYQKQSTVNKVLLNFDTTLLKGNIAIINPDLFNNLDKKVIPKKYTPIFTFKDEQKTFTNFHTFPDEKSTIDTLTSLITKDNENDIAIILNTQDKALSIIKSKLYSKKINLQIKDYLDEDLNTKAFLDFIKLALNLDNIKVIQILPFLRLFDFDIDIKYNNFLFSKYLKNISNDDKLKKLYNFIKNISQKTYSDLLTFFKPLDLPEKLTEVIYLLELNDKTITYQNFNTLTYYITNFQIEINSSKNGVLLVDSKSSSFIDKPVCFYYNPDTTWTKSVPNNNYIDKTKEEENNFSKFQILLTQGDLQYYFAPLIKDNEPNIPSFYFTQSEKRQVSTFNDPLFNSTNHLTTKNKNLELQNNKSSILYDFGTFSQSSLNKFFECPKKFEFSRLSSIPENIHFLKGTLLHAFAEFYVAYTNFCKEKGPDFFIDLILNEFSNLIDDINLDLERTNFSIGVKNIISFLDVVLSSKDFKTNHKITPSKDSKKHDDNFLSIVLNKPIKHNNVELSFNNPNTKLNGIIDFIINSTTIVDYKSSKKNKSIGEIITKSNIDLIKDKVDFQPLIYLLELSKHIPDKELTFYYNFFLNNKNEIISPTPPPKPKPSKKPKPKPKSEPVIFNSNLDENIVTVKYIPLTFNEFLATPKAIEIICLANKRKELPKLISSNTLISELKQNPIQEPLKFTLKEKAYLNLLEKLPIKLNKNGENSHKEKLDDFFKEIYRIRTGKSKYKVAFFFKEDLERFEQFVQEEHNKLNNYLKTEFPKKPLTKDICKKCDFKNICLGRTN